MKLLKTSEIDLADIRQLAQESTSLRVLEDLELDWVGGGDGPMWDNSNPPPTP